MLLIYEGDFGEAVAALPQFSGHSMQLEQALQLLDTDIWLQHDMVAVVMTNKRIAAVRKLEHRLRELNKRWALSFLNDRFLYCGPYFMPGRSACFDCFHRRDLSHLKHHQTAERELAIETFFSRQPQEQLPGYTSGLLHMTAGFLALCQQDRVEPGKLRRINIVDGPIEDTEVIAIHNCRTCRPHQEDYYAVRFVSDLVPELRRALS
jgi:uncharacterized OB-fold protein